MVSFSLMAKIGKIFDKCKKNYYLCFGKKIELQTMQRYFNTECACNPDRDYMVDITEKFLKTRRLIDNAKYFCINRARQFGKTTMLSTINKQLGDDYVVISISFENILDEIWQDTILFCKEFCNKISKSFLSKGTDYKAYSDYWESLIPGNPTLSTIVNCISDFCKSSDRKFVLLIDEVDNASNNELFIKFLAVLRDLYNQRVQTSNYKLTFYSVILAGVYDIRHLKLKIRPNEEHRHNSPWNVAADYNVDMTFNPREISTMLSDYEADHHTGMDIMAVSEEIHKFTSGYPFLVSKICSIIDNDIDGDFTVENIRKAVNILTRKRDITLFGSIINKLQDYHELNNLMYQVLVMRNTMITYEPNNPTIELASVFSLIKEDERCKVQVHNLVFETVIYNYLISVQTLGGFDSSKMRDSLYYLPNGDLNMEMLISRFQDLMHEEYRDRNEKFIEQQGRLLFLCFLKPLINGTGFYYVEPQIRENRRMDLVVTYNKKEYIIELKIWHGTQYETDGKIQLAEYLATRNMAEGYLVTFSFLKDKTLAKPSWVVQNGKRIFEAVI